VGQFLTHYPFFCLLLARFPGCSMVGFGNRGCGVDMRNLVTLALAALCAGCASITRGTTDQVQIISVPDGADVHTSMGPTCTTPCTLTFGRKDEFSVTVSKPGYEPQTVPVETRVAGAGAAGLAGNVIFGGLIGIGVDAYNGAELEHFPNPVSVELRRERQIPSPAPSVVRAPKARKPVSGRDAGVPQG
jgi:hypothetical protein